MGQHQLAEMQAIAAQVPQGVNGIEAMEPEKAWTTSYSVCTIPGKGIHRGSLGHLVRDG